MTSRTFNGFVWEGAVIGLLPPSFGLDILNLRSCQPLGGIRSSRLTVGHVGTKRRTSASRSAEIKV